LAASQTGSASQTQFAGKTILEGAPETLNAALAWGDWRDVGDPQLRQSAAELGRFSFTAELFFHRPVLIITNENAMTISVEAERNAVTKQQRRSSRK